MRLAITLMAVLLGLIVAVGAFYNAAGPAGGPAATPGEATQGDEREGAAPTPVEAADPATATGPAPAPGMGQGVDAAQPAPPVVPGSSGAAAVEPIAGLHVLPPSAEAPAGEATLGSTIGEMGFRMQIDFTRYGAGVTRIALTDHYETIQGDTPYVVHDTLTTASPGRATITAYPYAARQVVVNGAAIKLDNVPWSLVGRTETGGREAVEYRVTLADGSGAAVAEIVRRYTLAKRSFDFGIEQRVVNRAGVPLEVSFEQYIHGDLPDDRDYMGDMRKHVTGYFHPAKDPGRAMIWTRDAFLTRGEVVEEQRLWPNPNVPARAELAWLASENRYFAVVTHSAFPQTQPSGAGTTTAEVPALERLFPRVGTVVFPTYREAPLAEDRALVLTLGTGAMALPPGGSAELPLAVFAGPRQHEAFAEFPHTLLGLHELVRYELGCTWCTFQPLARGMLWLLKMFHALVKDWGIAIILLVLLVRLILHPITKKAQVNMMKMGKQMQSIQPEVEKLKRKYGDDQARVNQEMMKLYREKNINPANMLGCLPLLLQTPIWIALYAMLYFAIELRHEPAFYGVFQAVSGGSWAFLADLSTPDHFLSFGTGFRIPLPFVHNTINGINLLPLLMGVVFYFNMKFTTPPPPAKSEGEMTEQQRMMMQQQKIMRWVFPFMMPVFLYSAPSGLTLYICASTFAGIVDSYIVRKHVRDAEASGKLFDSKPVKPGSLRDKVQKYMERKQAELMSKQQELQKKSQGGGRGPMNKR